MNLALLLLTLAVVATVVAIVMGRLPGGMPAPSSSVPPVRLPDGPLTGADVHDLRFVPALRGYRMDQVDDALDRLAREVDRLRAYLPPEQLAALDAARQQVPLPGIPSEVIGTSGTQFATHPDAWPNAGSNAGPNAGPDDGPVATGPGSAPAQPPEFTDPTPWTPIETGERAGR